MKLEDLLIRLDERQEKMLAKQDDMNVTLVKQQASLDEHMRRTAANEAALGIMKDELFRLRSESVTWPFLGKAFSLIVPLAGTVVGVLKALGKL